MVYLKKQFVFLIPLVIGLAQFLLVVGPRVLDPSNIGWLEMVDTSTYYLGWEFFRNSPWTFPIGLNPSYGLEISNSIVYSDSNPLLAIIFKSVREILPHPFQYFGIWLLACFVLQAWFGWKLMKLLCNDLWICTFGAGLLSFSLPMLWRLHQNIQHLNLVAHFLILAALYLTLNKNQNHRRTFHWVLLIGLSALIHFYITAMVILLWLANLLQSRNAEQITSRQFIVEYFSVIGTLLFFFWQTGYFSISVGHGADGYGNDGLNLLSLIDSGKSDYVLWSFLLGDLPGDELSHEKFNFLGLGIISLIPLSLYSLIQNYSYFLERIKKNIYLVILLALLTLFSISHNVGIGSIQFKLDLFEPILRGFGGLFRASARMFWPVFYAIVFVLIALIVKQFQSKYAALILGLALAIQISDTSSGWMAIRSRLMAEPQSTWNTPMVDPFWQIAGKRYQKLRVPPSLNSTELGWNYLGYFSAAYGLKTNAAYLARVDVLAKEMIFLKHDELMQTFNYDKDTLYIIDDVMLEGVRRNMNAKEDLLIQVNGFNVLAPGWGKCGECLDSISKK
jgi:hypothetical protein